ncbi:hypothetical protein OC845_005201 [Tilletia horrida]|nr:hypothetical protein OC845_005201 [Tilletia horrida]
MSPKQASKKAIPLQASTVQLQIRDILNDDLLGSKMGEAIIRALKLQLQLHEQQDAVYRELLNQRDEDIVLPILKGTSVDKAQKAGTSAAGKASQTLFAQTAIQIATDLGRGSDGEAQQVIKNVPLVGTKAFRDAVFQVIRLPYPVINRALQFASNAASSGSPSEGGNAHQHSEQIDQWIIRNEKYMRARLILDAPETGKDVDQPVDENLAKLGIDRSSSHWQHFMVGLKRDATHVFGPSNESDGTITISRPSKADLPGLLILDHHRKEQIKINNLSAYERRFESMTRGILKGLDWNNVMVAGGLPLAVLTSVTDEQADECHGSDIDMYLYGLEPEQATAKLQEIEKVFSANLPIHEKTGEKMKYAVLRNAKTVTFVPEVYPNRRLQVILKLCPNPLAVLLNFDLDQVGVAYDGTEVWMLPRAARAIMTSYTVFTMDLIHGSYLSQRQATQDVRVYKYAQRGYGLRFLPSYLESLPRPTGEMRSKVEPPVKKAKLGSSIKDPHPDDLLHLTLLEERERVGWWLAQQRDEQWGPDTEPISMAKLYAGPADTSEVAAGRSGLCGFRQFVRHVALWEYSQMGYFPLDLKGKDFGPADYEDNPLSYQEGPEFSWDPSFTLEHLRVEVDEANQSDFDRLRKNLVCFGIIAPQKGSLSYKVYQTSKAYDKVRHLGPRHTLQKTIMASTLEEAFSQPLVAFVHLPRNFRAYIEPKLSNTTSHFADITRPGAPTHKPVRYDWIATYTQAKIRTDAEFVMSYWIRDGTEDGQMAPDWQLVDREADEIHEIVHAFRRGHRYLGESAAVRNAQVCKEVSRRLVRLTERIESKSFKAWAKERVEMNNAGGKEWGMLTLDGSMVLNRFKLSKKETRWYSYGDDDGNDDGSFNIEPKTAKEWLTHLKHPNVPGWIRWYRCRLPPAHLLDEIRSLAGKH